MNRIEIKVLNPGAVAEAEKMMVCAARLTQRGHQLVTMADFIELYEKEYQPETAGAMVELPHPTIQKFGTINVAVVGASRRFLAQITRHQNEVKFMSASLQYSDYSGSVETDFVVPYEILGNELAMAGYLLQCSEAMLNYKAYVANGVGNDAAGYMAPQGLRNILIISATPYQWKHMIGQRTCQRNTDETRYVMLRIWEQLFELDPRLFSSATTGSFCLSGPCKEGKMSCDLPFWAGATPTDLIEVGFPRLFVKG